VIEERPGLALAYSGRIANRRIKGAMAARGLKMSHGHVLMELATAGPMSQQALCESLGVDPSVLVAVLNDLENAGLAERRRDPADRRRHIVEMSPSGKGVVTEIHEAVAGVEAELFAGLDPAELATLHALLIRVHQAAGACTEAVPD
jgi:DNA-binding MarR family transcriptional regulator